MRRTAFLRRAVVLVLLGLVLAAATITTTSLVRRPDAPVAAAARTADVLANLPVSFEPTDDGFVSHGPGYSLTLTAEGATVDVGHGTFRLRPAGPLADPEARLAGGRPLPGTVSRLTGDDPSRWRTGLPTFAQVEVGQVWPGVDMVWHGDRGRLQHDMVVAPGVDPSVVAFDVDGARSLTVEPTGDLVIDLGAGSSRLARPVLYQDVAGQRRLVPGDFALLGPTRVGFSVGPYDADLPLVIDPTLVTSTFLGGAGSDSGYAVAVDAQGNTYVTGSTESADYPTRTPLQFAIHPAAAGPSADVFVTKVSSDGSRLEWSTYLGGQGRDTGYAVAVAVDGSVFVAGVTESPNFPLLRSAQANYGGGPSDAFLARIAANGTALEWSTVIGGAQTDRARGLALDSTGAAYVTGSTSSTDFPAVNPQQAGPFRDGDVDAFLVKVPSTGAPIAYSTRLGGDSDDHGLAVTVDTQNNAYVTGDTLSPGFPTVRPLQATFGGGAGGTFPDGFLAKYNPTGSALVYSTFLGGSDFDHGTTVAVDGQGAAYVAGNTNSSNFPTVSPLQATKANDSDVFVTKVDPAGGAIVYSTFLGGTGADGANAIAVDRTGSAHVVGTTASSNMPTAKATQATKGGGDDAFVLRLDSTGRGPLFSTFLGGRETESALGVALGSSGIVHVVGLTSSSDFPSMNPLSGSRPPAGGDAFLATLNLVDAAAPTPPPSQVAAPAASSSSDSHDRRVRILGALTVALLLAAGLQTMYLKRRTPATAGPAGRSRPPAPRATPMPGLKVLDQAGNPTKKAGATAKAPTPPRSARSPKTRGGPKGAAAKKGGSGAPSTPVAETVALTGGSDVTEVVEPDADGKVAVASGLGDDGGPPTVATPPPQPPKVKPQEPAIAALLEEDLWLSESNAPRPAEPSEPVEASDGSPAAVEAETAPATQPAEPEWAPFDTGSTPVVGAAEPGEPPPPPPAIPPVPAEELSFWDLFPEDLPPARATAFPAEDLLAPDHLALPEGPQTAANRLVGSDPDDASVPPYTAPPAPAEPSATRPPPDHRPEAEIVIAELLDGPPPTGIPASAESQWAASPNQAPDDDFLIDDLLADQHRARSAGPPSAANGEGEDQGPAAPGLSRQEQRIAADRARRQRSRRGGRGEKSPGTD